MRLERLDLTAFGHFSGQTLDFGRRADSGTDLHIVYGDNEAGKTTLLSAIVELLFGMPTRSAWNFQHANNVLEIGARLSASQTDPSGALEVRRYKNRLTDTKGQRLDDVSIDTHGLSRDAFRARFSLDDQVLEQGSEAILKQEGELGAALFGASSGLADISARLDDAMADANRFWQPNKRVGIELPELCKRLDELKQSHQDRDLDARDWKRLRKTLDTQREAHDALSSRLKALETAQRRQERDRTAMARAIKLKAMKHRLAELSAPPIWSGERPRSAAKEIQELALFDARIATKQEQRHLECRKQERLIVDSALLDARHRIDALVLERHGIESEQAERARLDEQRQALMHRRDSLRTALSALPMTDGSAPLLSAEVLDTLDKLAREHASLVADHQAARRELSRAEHALSDHDSAYERCAADDGLGDEATPVGPSAASGEVVSREDVRLTRLQTQLDSTIEDASASRLTEARHRLATLEQEKDTAFAQLAPWQGDGDALASLSVPDDEALDALQSRLTELSEQTRLSGEQRQVTERRIAELESEVQQEANEGGIESVDVEASLILQKRSLSELESAIEAVESRDVLIDRLTALRAAMAGHDALIRQWVRFGDATVRLQQALRSLDVERDALTTRLADCSRIEVSLQEARTTLQQFNEPIQLPSPTPATLREWRRKRDEAIASHRRYAEGEAAVTQQQARVDANADALRQALAPCLEDIDQVVSLETPLPTLISIAQETLSNLQTRQADHAQARAESLRLERDVRQRKRSERDSNEALDDWAGRWHRALLANGLGEDWATVPAADIIDRLPAIRQYVDSVHTLMALETTRAQQDTRLVQWCDAVQTLNASLTTSGAQADAPIEETQKQAPDQATASGHSHTPEQTLATLKQRLDDTLAAQAEHQRSREACESLETDIRSLVEQSQPLRVQIADWMRLARCDSPDDLQRSLESMAEHDDLQAAIHELEQDLQTTLSPEPLNEALQRLESLDVAALEVDIQQTADQVLAMREQVSEAQRTLTTLELDTGRVSDDESIADLVEQRVNLLLDIETRARETLSLRLGKLAVEAALRRYRDSHRSGMLSHASQAFRELTRGHYVDLRAQPDQQGQEKLIGVRSNGVSLQATQMSKGTRFQLFLALRIAAYHEYADQRTPLPFVADDILESSDNHRTRAAIGQLHAMSRRGQIIYLTHHQHLVDMARDLCGDELRIHHLP